MTRTLSFLSSAIIALLFVSAAQSQPGKPVLGTVSGFKPENLQIEIRSDSGEVSAVSLSADTLVQRVAPGEKDLRRAARIEVTAIALGDRVLISYKPGSADAQRIVVMAAGDITKRNEASRQEWQQHGVSGIVSSKKGNEITLRSRSMQGEITSAVTISEATRFRRYAPDSVRFADARESSLAEVKPGDQLRARGEKSADGLRVTAGEIVFGTFLVKAGTITGVEPADGIVTVKDLESGKLLTIHVAADTQMKRMPDFGGTMGGRPGTGSGAGTPGGPGSAPGAMRGQGGTPDLAQMLDRIPQAKIDSFRPGDTIIVSSTKGASTDQVTAIMLLGNAGMIVQMATTQPSRDRQGGMGGMGMGGMGNGLGSLELPSMMP